jgi:hypothetical protein
MTFMAMMPSRRIRAWGRRAMLLGCAPVLWLGACSDSDPTDPNGPGPGPGNLLVITSIPNQSGTDGSSFLQTTHLEQGQLTNANAYEQTYIAYASVYGDDVIVTQHLYGDQAVRYVRESDGTLTEAGRMNLPPGSMGTNVVYASPEKAYLAATYEGKVLVLDPQTMTTTGEIDLTTLDLARNPPDDPVRTHGLTPYQWAFTG